MTRHLHSDHKDPHRTRHGIRWLPTALSTLLFMLLMPASAQTPVNIRSASYSGRSLEWSQGDPYSAGYVETSIDADTKQQWVMVNAGNGSFYLKNVAAEAAGANPYLTLYKSGASNDNWTFSMTDETGLASEIHYFRARFSLVDNGDGTWAFKTMSSKNNAATHIYTYIGIDAPSGSRTHHTIWGDKQIADGGKWTIDGLSTINIERSAGTITITATNTTDATVYYTTDGTDPTTSTTRQVYSTSFADNNIALVKAIVMKDGRPNSELALSYDYSMSFVLQHQLNTEFYMLPGALNGNDYEVNTYSLPRPSMTWKLEDAGDGSVYLRNDSTGYYLSCNDGGTVRLKATNNQSNDFKFWLRLAVDGTYRLEAKAKTYSFITKSDNNSHNSVGYNNNAKISLQNYWRIIPADHMPALEPPFTLSDNSCAHYYRLQNGGESAYYIIPPTESNVNASASNAGERNDRWFLRQVGSDEWLTYYAIVNATTGQCLQYNGVALGGGAAFITDTVAEDDMGTTDNIQFAVAPTTTSATNGMYYLVPKLIRYQNSGNYYSLVRYDNTVLKVNSQRADDKHKWVFAASTFNCDAPTVSYDAVQGILTLTSPNNAPLYYVAWADGEAEPALATPAEGTLYSEPFFVEQNTHFKAIAARCTDGSDQSAVTAYDLAEAFRCARPKITYNSSTKQVSIASATTGADIYYIVGSGDFSESAPNYGGSLYSAPFTLSEPQVVKAIAVKDGVWSTVSVTTVWDEAPHPVSLASEMTVMSLNYVANEGFVADVTVGTESNPFTGSFDGGYHPISLSQPLFGHVDGGTVKNVRVLTLGADFNGTNVGAIANEAKGDTKIYNCGVLDSTKTIAATNAAGGIVGHIASGAAVRVVNCYNYATVAGSVYSGGIVGWNESSTANGTRIAMCMMYGDMTVGTHRSPVYYGGHTSNNQSYTEYNYWRSRADLDYTDYNDQLAIGRDEWLTRFPFYRHILNTHRELAAHFLFGDLSALTTTAPTEKQVDEIGHWALHTDVAPYPIVEPWEKNTKKTTEGIAAALPATTNRYEGKKLADIAADGIYRSDGTQVTTMGTNGMLHVNYTIAGTTGSLDLPITDMDTLAYDFTWGKVVLPFVNEIDGWTRDYSKICTGWKITAVIGGTTGTLTNYNFADRDCTAKDLYSNSNYIFAQGGNYIVPYGVTSIDIEANFATAYYLSDEYADFGYNATYEGPTALGWAMPATYHGQNVYTNLNTLLGDMSDSADPHSQAIVLVGNYHYNQKVISGSGVFNNYYGKALTIMSVDEDNNQEPDYGWYSYHSNPRTGIPHLRFDFVPNIGIGMAARVTGSTPNPTIGIWQCSGSFELTETCVSFMSECEIEGSTKKISTADNELGNNRYIVNSGYFIQIIRSHNEDVSNLSYLKVGGNAFIEQLYPGTHSNSAQKVKLVPIVVTGGEIKDCYMTGYRAGSVAYGPDIRFWCAGGRIHKFLGAYMDKPRQTANADGHVNMTARVDHALIRRFFGGGTSPNARITGDINVTMNNSRVDFFCGGPEFGDMASGKTVTTHATGTTFGMYYGAGFGGTSITRVRGNNASSNTDGQTEVTFSNDTDTFPLAFDNYKYLTPKTGYGIGVNYEFEFIQYAGGDGRGVARFYTGYAAFSLAQTGNIGNTLTHCTVLGNFYGGGCQGTVDGDISSTLTDCTVKGNAFAAGFQASANTLEVFPNTQPSYSVYTKETGLFSDFGTVAPDTWTWEEGAENTYNADTHTIYTSTDMDILGTVKGNTNLTIGGNSIIGTDGDATTGSVYGGGEESAVLGDTRVLLKGNALVLGNVFGGGNLGSVGGNTDVRICDECSIE